MQTGKRDERIGRADASDSEARVAQHTPGPWLVEPINGGETFQITSGHDRHFSVIAETPVDGTGGDEANARLIAAAPDLLEACKAAVNSLVSMRPAFAQAKDEGHAFNDQIIEFVNAAIAKAEGSQ